MNSSAMLLCSDLDRKKSPTKRKARILSHTIAFIDPNLPPQLHNHLKKLLWECGAAINSVAPSTASTTHVICYPAQYQKYNTSLAPECHIVKPLWVLKCHLLNSHQQESLYSPDPALFLSGILFFFDSSLSNNEQEVLKSLTLHYGGSTCSSFSSQCTHVIFSPSSKKKKNLPQVVEVYNNEWTLDEIPPVSKQGEFLAGCALKHGLHEWLATSGCVVPASNEWLHKCIYLQKLLPEFRYYNKNKNNQDCPQKLWLSYLTNHYKLKIVKSEALLPCPKVLSPRPIFSPSPPNNNKSKHVFSSSSISPQQVSSRLLSQDIDGILSKSWSKLNLQPVLTGQMIRLCATISGMQRRLVGSLILQLGAKIDENSTTIVTTSQRTRCYKNHPNQCVSLHWLFNIADTNQVPPITNNNHPVCLLWRPPPFACGISSLRSCVISVTGFDATTSPTRKQLRRAIAMIGGCYIGPMSRERTTHLICRSRSSSAQKYGRAAEWGISIVNVRWVFDCLKYWKRVDEREYAAIGCEFDFSYSSSSAAENTSPRKKKTNIKKRKGGFQIQLALANVEITPSKKIKKF